MSLQYIALARLDEVWHAVAQLGMGQASGDKIDPKRIGGIKRLRHLLPLLAPLHEVGCQRDRAGNRLLHFDEYVTLVLLCLTNPLIKSVRALQQAGEIQKVADQLGVRRFSLGSFSESVRVFDPEKLREVIGQLAGELQTVNVDPRLRTHLDQALRIVDGTVLDAIATPQLAAPAPRAARWPQRSAGGSADARPSARRSS